MSATNTQTNSVTKTPTQPSASSKKISSVNSLPPKVLNLRFGFVTANLDLKLPRVSFSLTPRYKLMNKNTKKEIDKMDVDIKEFCGTNFYVAPILMPTQPNTLNQL